MVILTKPKVGDNINRRLKDLRNNLRINQADFGRRIGVTGSAVSMWESGDRGIPESAILSICREFGVNEVWLRTGEGDPFLSTDREAELGELIRTRLLYTPPGIQRAVVTALLKFDPNGPEWAIVERIYQAIAAELSAAPQTADECGQNDKNPREA